MRLLPLALLALCLLSSPAQADGPDPDVAVLEARLAADPIDADALLGLADLHAEQGEIGFARRYLRAFLRLVPMHPRRVEAAQRAAALRPASPWVIDEDARHGGGFLVYQNQLDGSRAVRVPEGVYVRRLRPDHAKDEDVTMDVRFDVHVDTFLVDLHETPRRTWDWFLLESGFSVPAYWGNDATTYLASTQESTGHPWVWLAGTFDHPAHPAWPLSWHEARALARAAGKRLPTEAEWEKAARGGRFLDADQTRPNPHPQRPYPWGLARPEGAGTVRVNATGTGIDNGPSHDDRSIPVDALPEGASPYGCLNMLGNVQEWCRDWYWPDEEILKLAPSNPLADRPDPTGELERSKIVKGGYFNWSANRLAIDERPCHTYDVWSMALLFKCALRGFSDAPLLPEDEPDDADSNDLDVPRNDPLDGARYLEAAKALEHDDPARAWRHARAAARLLRHGPARERAVALVERLRPTDIFERLDDGRFRNRVDGGIAVRDGDLLVDVHEVTEGQYLTFLAETARTPDAMLGINPLRYRNGDLPAATLTHAEARAYGRWAGKRLPTRAEWLRIARAAESPFPWGDAPVAGRAAVQASIVETDVDPWDLRFPVGSFPAGANPKGVLDLVGNVAEWCADGPVEDPDYGGSWLVGGDIRHSDVETPEDWRDTHAQDYPPGYDARGYYGARCVALPPR